MEVAVHPEKIKSTIAEAQGKWWEKQGLESPVVSLEDFEAGRGRVPDIKGAFGFFPTSILLLNRPKELYDYMADKNRPRHPSTAVYKHFPKFSHFPPAVAWFAVKYWSQPGDLVLDPFGNRANIGLVANWLDRRVILNDISPKYCRMMRDAGRRRARKNRSWKVLNQDAARLRGIKKASVDLVLTGPPYFNLEKYDDVPGQASNYRTYKQFLRWYALVAKEMLRVIKAGRFCVYKVGNWRRNGRLVLFVRDTIETFEKAGWIVHDEIICVEPAPLGLGFNWPAKWKKRHVHKAHQTVLVFKKPE
jgi:DNA modification methylase